MGYMTFNRYQYGHHFVFANHKTHCTFFFVRERYQQRATAPTTVRQNVRRCDIERALGGNIWCVKKLFG